MSEASLLFEDIRNVHVNCREPTCSHKIDFTDYYQQVRVYGQTINHTEIGRVCREHPGKLTMRFALEDNAVTVTANWSELLPGEGYVPCLAILKTDNADQEDPIYLVIREDYYSGQKSLEENFESRAYWYNQHTCISNWLGVEQVINREYIDPHGAFVLYKLIPQDIFHAATGGNIMDYYDRNGNEGEDELFHTILPELFQGHRWPKK